MSVLYMFHQPIVSFPTLCLHKWRKGYNWRPYMSKYWGRGPGDCEWRGSSREHEVQSELVKPTSQSILSDIVLAFLLGLHKQRKGCYSRHYMSKYWGRGPGDCEWRKFLL